MVLDTAYGSWRVSSGNVLRMAELGLLGHEESSQLSPTMGKVLRNGYKS